MPVQWWELRREMCDDMVFCLGWILAYLHLEMWNFLFNIPTNRLDRHPYKRLFLGLLHYPSGKIALLLIFIALKWHLGIWVREETLRRRKWGRGLAYNLPFYHCQERLLWSNIPLSFARRYLTIYSQSAT